MSKQLINGHMEGYNRNIFIDRRSPEERREKQLLSIYRMLDTKIDANGVYKGNLDLEESPIETLGNKIKVVKGNLNLYNCSNLEDLGSLEEIEGWVDLEQTPIKTLGGKLKVVKGGLYLYGCKNLKDLGSLLEVGGSLYLRNTPIGDKLENGELAEEDIRSKIKIKRRLEY